MEEGTFEDRRAGNSLASSRDLFVWIWGAAGAAWGVYMLFRLLVFGESQKGPWPAAGIGFATLALGLAFGSFAGVLIRRLLLKQVAGWGARALAGLAAGSVLGALLLACVWEFSYALLAVTGVLSFWPVGTPDLLLGALILSILFGVPSGAVLGLVQGMVASPRSGSQD